MKYLSIVVSFALALLLAGRCSAARSLSSTSVLDYDPLGTYHSSGGQASVPFASNHSWSLSGFDGGEVVVLSYLFQNGDQVGTASSLYGSEGVTVNSYGNLNSDWYHVANSVNRGNGNYNAGANGLVQGYNDVWTGQSLSSDPTGRTYFVRP